MLWLTEEYFQGSYYRWSREKVSWTMLLLSRCSQFQNLFLLWINFCLFGYYHDALQILFRVVGAIFKEIDKSIYESSLFVNFTTVELPNLRNKFAQLIELLVITIPIFFLWLMSYTILPSNTWILMPSTSMKTSKLIKTKLSFCFKISLRFWSKIWW